LLRSPGVRATRLLLSLAGAVITLLPQAAFVLAGPSQRAALFTAPPTDIQNVAGVVPLGNTNPGGSHVLAVDHMYLNYPHPDNGGADSYPVYAMAAGKLVMVQRSQNDGRPDPDYQIIIKYNRFVTSQFDHLR
jgi:hypothetical protein